MAPPRRKKAAPITVEPETIAERVPDMPAPEYRAPTRKLCGWCTGRDDPAYLSQAHKPCLTHAQTESCQCWCRYTAPGPDGKAHPPATPDSLVAFVVDFVGGKR